MGQTYRYKNEESILYGLHDEYSLSQTEFYMLYAFYVTYSMCGTQSAKQKQFTDYGWTSNKICETVDSKRVDTPLGKALKKVLQLDAKASKFIFTEEDDLEDRFIANGLGDGILPEYDDERAVVARTQGNNKYTKLFYRIRDGLAHGKFILKLSSDGEKMVLIQDNDSYNVTARILLKLDTMLGFARTVSNGRL